jgi:hypothetical protein
MYVNLANVEETTASKKEEEFILEILPLLRRGTDFVACLKIGFGCCRCCMQRVPRNISFILITRKSGYNSFSA